MHFLWDFFYDFVFLWVGFSMSWTGTNITQRRVSQNFSKIFIRMQLSIKQPRGFESFRKVHSAWIFREIPFQFIPKKFRNFRNPNQMFYGIPRGFSAKFLENHIPEKPREHAEIPFWIDQILSGLDRGDSDKFPLFSHRSGNRPRRKKIAIFTVETVYIYIQ